MVNLNHHNVVEAHCNALQCIGALIVSNYVDFCMHLTKAFVAEMSCNQLLIDSATYSLTINSPTYTITIAAPRYHQLRSIKLQYIMHVTVIATCQFTSIAKCNSWHTRTAAMQVW